MTKKLRTNRAAISTMLIVAVVVVIIIVAAAAGAYYFLGQNPAPSTNPTETPGASTEPSSSPDVAGASSLQYSVSLTENGVVTASYTFYGKNAGTSDFAMRIDQTDENGEASFIFNAGTKEAWTYAAGEWLDISDYFDQQYAGFETLWAGYVDSLSAWAGTGDYSYTAAGVTYRIYDISVNPALADSLFTHS
jgi:hypothetical protein